MEIHTLQDIAISTALSAGNAVMDLYDISDFKTKTDGSPVTVADCTAHDIICEALQKTGITVLSEEADGILLPYPEYVWIIDPIDGTSGFINNTGDFAIMIGLLERGVPVLGVVYAPAYDALYYASHGNGAHVTKHNTTSRLTIAKDASTPLRFISSSNHYSSQMEQVREKLGAIKVSRGGVGIKAMLIAENDGDFFFTGAPLGEWDVCAPHCILEESGALVTDCNGNPLVYGNEKHRITQGAIFSHPACHDVVRKAIQNQ